MKRVLAWILLVGFLLLIVNLLIFQFFIGPSVMVYVLVIVVFLFTNTPLNSNNNKSKKDTQNNSESATYSSDENTED